jgi:hypothetical protein
LSQKFSIPTDSEEIRGLIKSLPLAMGQERIQNVSNGPNPKREKQNPLLTQNISDIVNEISSRIRGPQREPTAISNITNAIAYRRGQAKFREDLFKNYGRKCMVTEEEVETVIEAAHIRPYIEDHNFDVENGLLLRSDLHTLFDLGLMIIHPETFDIVFDDLVKRPPYDDSVKYGKLHIEHATIQPDKTALWERYRKVKNG